MSAAAAAPPATSLLRPAAASLTTASNSSNRVHLKNLEHLFRNRGAAVAVESATPAQQQQPVLKAPLLRLPSFLARGRGEVAMKEEAHGVSPRRLERVLLPAAPDGPSPRGNIAATWRRLHGEHDWRGLLDPLHPDLRREIVRYGEFVGAAYGAFLSRPDAAPGDRARAAPPLQDGGAYRVTAPLFATSSVGLPAWLASAAPCAAQRTSLVGYVAVCDSPAEVRRMGRRDIVIALRGTCTVLEWAENVRAGLVPATEAASAADSPDAPTPKVECGFWNLYKTAAADGSPSLSEMVVTEVRRLLTKYEGEEVSITVTGHSLGAALAVLIADELAGLGAPAPVAVFSFGGPRVGDRAFASRVEARGARVLRVVNAHDVVPRFPPPSRYADVGRELRLDSRASPYLRPDADAACCHDLEAYIHLVDGFLGSHCPFRDNAKRSILRLLENQGGNVKQLYISKAMDMRVRLDAAVADMPAEVLECVH
ncbi:phospholipase A1-Ibeta2, chloroplastic-like [Oryza glaberrima]|uniref:Fungal lipase-type domain-containing protein n=1 Tax=Oryza glaberrima TaxID=4538 RepID=I1QFL4_ORYGL|nr:phospholipase A1-Ibeta2, chloroplastic-like [Oryza glaberrima]